VRRSQKSPDAFTARVERAAPHSASFFRKMVRAPSRFSLFGANFTPFGDLFALPRSAIAVKRKLWRTIALKFLPV